MAGSLRRQTAGKVRPLILVTIGAAALGAWMLLTKASGPSTAEPAEVAGHSRAPQDVFSPAAAQWTTLSVEPVSTRVFRDEHVTEGKIAVDEDRSTLVFS